MKHIQRTFILGSLIGALLTLLGGCREGGSIPRLEALRAQSPSPYRSELWVSTNCAEIGELVTIRVTIENHGTAPILLTGTPLLDIVIEPYNPVGAAVRWSETPGYEADLTPIMAPGSKRTFEWQWVAAPEFGEGNMREQGARIRLEWRIDSPGHIDDNAGPTPPTLGINALPTFGLGGIACSSLKR